MTHQSAMVIPSDENEKAIRSNETLKLIENFVEKAEKVLQVEVSEVTSLQNKVDSFSVGEDEEVSPESRERHVNYATYKSSQMIREHLKLHKSPERNVTLAPRLSWAHLQPWVVPAIPVVVLLALVARARGGALLLPHQRLRRPADSASKSCIRSKSEGS